MKKFINFEEIPQPGRALAEEAIVKFSLYPESKRLIFPLAFVGANSLLIGEIPVDDPRLSMLVICYAPASVVKVSYYDSPRLTSHIDKYRRMGGKDFPQRGDDVMNGSQVVSVQRTNLGIRTIDSRVQLQFHPLYNIRTNLAGPTTRWSMGLVNRFTNTAGQAKTSDGCVAITTREEFLKSGGFNYMDPLQGIREQRDGTLATLGTPAVLTNFYEPLQLKRLAGTRFDKLPSDLSMLEAGILLREGYEAKYGTSFLKLD